MNLKSLSPCHQSAILLINTVLAAVLFNCHGHCHPTVTHCHLFSTVTLKLFDLQHGDR